LFYNFTLLHYCTDDSRSPISFNFQVEMSPFEYSFLSRLCYQLSSYSFRKGLILAGFYVVNHRVTPIDLSVHFDSNFIVGLIKKVFSIRGKFLSQVGLKLGSQHAKLINYF